MSETDSIEGLLLERWRAGDATAAAELVRLHQDAVYGFLLSMCGQRAAAQDLLQETFLRVLERDTAYTEQGRFRALVFRIARNLCTDHFRRKARRKGAPLRALDTLPGPEDLERRTLDDECGRRLRQAIAALPEAQREVVLLHYYSELSFREIAELQGCPLGTCLGRMHYALRQLRRLVPEQEWAHGV